MPLSITASTLKPTVANADMLVLPLTSALVLGRHLPEGVRRRLGVHIRRLEFTGAWGGAVVFVSPPGIKAPFTALIGLGDVSADEDILKEGMRRGLGKALQEARRHFLHTIAITLVDMEKGEALAAAASEAALLANYRFTEFSAKHKRSDEATAARKLNFLVARQNLGPVRQAIDNVEAVMPGVTLARQLVNLPASHMSPRTLMEEARAISRASQRINLKIFDRQQALEAGFTAFLSVAAGSKEEPYVLHLSYKPAGAVRRKLCLVGKGITFDSGGLSLKPANAMESMKIDMAGAAAVLGLFSVVEKLAPDVEVHGIIAACENMPSGSAYRPGDIVPAKNGKTIEIFNTDAEGRVTLADALSYAVELKPDAIVDLATLTGACMVALGETHAGLFTNNTSLEQQLLTAARSCGEGLTALPLPEEYRPTIESVVADVRNTATTVYGGAITAALFLQAFVNDVPWAHMDIAGPVFAERALLPYFTPGATGYGVRTLAEFVKSFSISPVDIQKKIS